MEMGAKQGGVVIGRAESVCPVCLRRISGDKVAQGDDVHLVKRCPEHGVFRTILWRGPPSYAAWGQAADPAPTPEVAADDGCPTLCGLCAAHRQHSCCVLLEVTRRCNLACPVCFARAGGGGADPDPDLDPDFAELADRMTALRGIGRNVNLQFSGGEPTVRDDLADLVRLARRLEFPFLQLNTNGLRLAGEGGYAESLAAAGLDCVFLQFDAISDQPYRRIRAGDLFAVKDEAVRRCAAAGLGVVLVPTLVPEVNTGQVGDIIRYAVGHMPTVRAVHFQPISYFGRHPANPRDGERLTLPELLRLIEGQTDGAILAGDFKPASAENPYCSFSGRFLALPVLEPAGGARQSCCRPADPAERARQFVARHWIAREEPSCCGGSAPADDFDDFLARQSASLCISGMVFQDAWTLELDRLRQCHIHVAEQDRRLIPLCAYNLSAIDGSTLYRGRVARR